MPIEPVKIPQNVYVEDRIIGPVSLRQLIITGVGAGISYMIFSAASKAGVSSLPIKVMCWIPALIAAMFAFLKINDLSLLRMILLAAEGMNKPRERVWSSPAGLSINLITRETVQNFDAAQAKVASTAIKLSTMTHDLEIRQKDVDKRMAVADEHVLDDMTRVSPKTEPVVAEASPNETEIPVRNTSDEDRSAFPVAKSRIGVSNLDPSRSIDTIVSGDIPALIHPSTSL